jgi:Lipid A 3-O-deacylase (PagL)
VRLSVSLDFILKTVPAVWLAVVALATPVFAQETTAPAETTPAVDLFDRNALAIEFGGALSVEAWNLNGRREHVAELSGAVSWAFAPGVALHVELRAIRVFQNPSRNALVTGLAPLLRWRMFDGEASDLFVEVGPGASWSDTRVPPRGTTFNYLFAGGFGLSHRVARQTHAVVSFRWLHLSNNGLEGPSRNPDIEALGGYGGVSVVF